MNLVLSIAAWTFSRPRVACLPSVWSDSSGLYKASLDDMSV